MTISCLCLFSACKTVFFLLNADVINEFQHILSNIYGIFVEGCFQPAAYFQQMISTTDTDISIILDQE